MQSLEKKELLRKTALTEYFAMNARTKLTLSESGTCPCATNPLDCNYLDLSGHFVWNQKTRQWTSRNRKIAIGRIYCLGPKAGDKFNLRLLLSPVKGATSFQGIRTVDGETCPTYKDACRRLNLTLDDKECEECLAKAATISTAGPIRSLLVALLIECEPVNPRRLWDQFKHK